MQAAIQSFTVDLIPIDVLELGTRIQELIQDVGQLHTLSVGDLVVKGAEGGQEPVDVRGAVRYGTKFFDALLYFSIPVDQRPAVQVGDDGEAGMNATMLLVKRHLLWMALFLMLRGSYPSDADNNVGTNVPAFLRNICGMDISPRALADSLASFPLVNINPGWIKHIDWRGFAPEIRQRLGLGLAGYRQLGPFTCYPVKAGATEEVKAAVAWIVNVAQRPADYAMLSCTRSPAIVNRFKSLNKSLGNLILLSFTEDQITEMVNNKIIFARPVRDPRADTWRGWVAGGELVLNDPVKL